MRIIGLKFGSIDGHIREVFRGASVAFVMKASGAGLEFLFSILLARMLGAEGAGIFFLALTVTTFATVLGRVGLDHSLLRFVAANAGKNDWSAVKGVHRKGILLALLASSVSTVAVFFMAPSLAQKLFQKPELIEPLRWMTLSIVPTALVLLYAQMLRGLKRIFASSLVDQHGIGLSLIPLAGLYLLGRKWGIIGAVWAHDIGAAVALVIAIGMWLFVTPQLRHVKGHFSLRELLSSCLPLFWVASINMIMNWTTSVALGIWGTTKDVGVFNVASRTAMLTTFVLFAINSIAAPKFAELYRQGNMDALRSLATNSSKLMVMFAGPVLLFFLLFPQWVMGLFGPQFASHGIVLVILSAGQFVNTATGSVGFLLLMCGKERLTRNNVAFTLILNVVLNVILTPMAGVVGAACATAISLATRNLISEYLVWKSLNIRTLPLELIDPRRIWYKLRPTSRNTRAQ